MTLQDAESWPGNLSTALRLCVAPVHHVYSIRCSYAGCWNKQSDVHTMKVSPPAGAC